MECPTRFADTEKQTLGVDLSAVCVYSRRICLFKTKKINEIIFFKKKLQFIILEKRSKLSRVNFHKTSGTVTRDRAGKQPK